MVSREREILALVFVQPRPGVAQVTAAEGQLMEDMGFSAYLQRALGTLTLRSIEASRERSKEMPMSITEAKTERKKVGVKR